MESIVISKVTVKSSHKSEKRFAVFQSMRWRCGAPGRRAEYTKFRGPVDMACTPAVNVTTSADDTTRTQEPSLVGWHLGNVGWLTLFLVAWHPHALVSA